MLGLQWQVGGHGAARWAADGKFDLRKMMFLTRNLGFEVRPALPVVISMHKAFSVGCRLCFGTYGVIAILYHCAATRAAAACEVGIGLLPHVKCNVRRRAAQRSCRCRELNMPSGRTSRSSHLAVTTRRPSICIWIK